MRRYLAVLRSPGVPRLLIGASLSRVASSMLGLALMIAALDRFSIAVAGASLAAVGVGIAVATPITARLAARFGASLVLGILIAAHIIANAAVLVALIAGNETWLLVLSAGLLGASSPPSSPVTRALWPRLVVPARLPTAYALDSTLNSAMFVAGPALVAVLGAAIPPPGVAACAALFRVAGDILVASTPQLPSRADHSGRAHRVRTGPLADPRVRLLLLASACDAVVYGVLQIGAAANGPPGAAAGVLTLLAVGEIAGGLIVGSRTWPGTTRTQLVVLHTGTALLLLIPLPIGAPVFRGGLYAAAGLGSGARDALGQVALGQSAGTRAAEAFAWLGSVTWGGFALGTAVAGTIARAASPLLFPVAAGFATIAAILVVATVRQPTGSEGSTRTTRS